MTTPLDKLRRYGCELGTPEEAELSTRIFDEMRDAPLLDISNVTSYYYKSTADGKEWLIGDFPNLAPAFDACWVSSSKAPQGFDGFVMAAAHRDLWEQEEAEILDVSTLEFNGAFANEGFIESIPRPENVRWMQEVLSIIQIGTRFVPSVLSTRYINEDGSPYLVGGRPKQLARVFGRATMNERQMQDAVVVAGRLMEYPLLLATSLMHCRNVRLMEDDPPPRLSRKWKRKHGFPLAKRYTLLIDPMRRVLESEGGATANGLPKALHICRGHFKTYSEERPMFGKLSGTFWWPQHARGSEKHGEVIKDYSVKAPKS